MRTNIAIASNASFQAARREAPCEARADLPVTLPWRSSLWLYIVPTLWVAGWMLWSWVVSVETPRWGLAFYALLFIGIPLILALTGGWWVRQLLHRRTSAKFVVTDDYLEWQFEMGSDLDPLVDCSRFALIGKRGFDARIEWDIAKPEYETAEGWRLWLQKLLSLDWIKSDRTLYGRDVGLDRDGLERLCKLLNQLRDGAKAGR